MSRSNSIDHAGRVVDFGRTATDYDRFRPGFPESFFERVAERGWIDEGVRALDLGTGTGSLALGLARRGLAVTGIDPAEALLDVARARASAAGVEVCLVRGTAERTGLDAGSFELVTAGQCWWWFDEPAVLAEVRRILVSGGRLLIANFSYLPLPGSVAERTEDLILKYNPGWTKARETGYFPAQIDALDRAGFHEVESFSYVENVTFSHERWRGRIRACNGVGAALAPEAVDVFDRDLATALANEFPTQLAIPHRIFVATAIV